MMLRSRAISPMSPIELIVRSPTRWPILSGSLSSTAATVMPCSAKIGELAIALPSRPAPTSAMLCWPCVRRICRISSRSASVRYPTPRLPNLPNAERSRRICVALMFVYSEISCDEIRSLPILRAWVRTWRYRLRRAATPTVRRSVTCSPPRKFVTKRHDSASGSSGGEEEPFASGAQTAAKALGVDEIRERELVVDLDHGKALPVPRLELRPAADVDDLELEAELVVQLPHDLERPCAE